MTEIRVLDTYWSDHCRHTTFSTELTEREVRRRLITRRPWKAPTKSIWMTREDIYKGRDDKFVCLMDLALMAMKKLKTEGKLAGPWRSPMRSMPAVSWYRWIVRRRKKKSGLINFKNETHNHPTEIEPFGGAATCLGGAIRDPLSGRTYVYQAMRVTGAADPTVSV